MSDPRLVAIVDTNIKHAQKVGQVLRSYFNTIMCTNGERVINSLETQKPSIILLASGLLPHGSMVVVEAIKHHPDLSRTEIIFIAEDESDPDIAKAKELGIKNILIKPYMPSTLIQTISNAISGNVEKQWEKLEAKPREALQNTVGIFRSISDVLITGEDISFNDVKENCSSLVEVVESNDFGVILDGVRNHDDYTFAHSLRVATLLTLLGHAAGFKKNDQLIMSSGGLLHDVGKMMIPHHILNKPGKLTDEEFEIMKSHVPETVSYLERTGNIPKAVMIIAEQHHEKIDGTGYPHGKKGKELNELARMAAIVDVFSALTDRRIYKPPMESSKAIGILEDMSGHLDQNYVKMFKGVLIDTGILK